ncbi:MAG: hypothetical protein SGI73_02770 [Chloroflexota bacterium]|nr:hypothetical protein [Chloroflexota bacterium]
MTMGLQRVIGWWRRSADHPIQRAEFAHQMRAGLMPTPQRTRRGLSILLVMIAAASACKLMLSNTPYWASLTGASSIQTFSTLNTIQSTLIFLILSALGFQHWRWLSAAARGAAGAIARERGGRTWEALILTGVDAQHIVAGKWQASLRIALTDGRSLLSARTVAVLWLFTPLVGLNGAFGWNAPPPITVVLAAIVALSYPLIFSVFSAACGLLASALSGSETTAARISGLTLVGGMIIGGAMNASALAFAGVLFRDINFTSITFLSAVTPIDGGILTILTLTLTDSMEFARRDQAEILLIVAGAMAINLAVYAAVTWSALRVSVWLVLRNGASRHTVV